MGDARSSDKSVPPYLPYRTLRSYIDAWKQGVPQRIDRTVMRTTGGTLQKQLIHAWRYLGLTDEFGLPQENLRQWVMAEGKEREEALQRILKEAYPSLCGDRTNGFDLATATSGQLNEKIEELGIRGDTVRKAEAFFLNAASDAAMKISSFIKPVRQQGGARRAPRQRNGQRARRRNDAEEDVKTDAGYSPSAAPVPQAPILPRPGIREALIQALVGKLPEFNPAWEPDVQQKWFEAWNRLAQHLETGEEDS